MKHSQLLRWSLLSSLGLAPLGCGSQEAPAECRDPVTNAELGLVECAQGYRYRIAAVACGPTDGPDQSQLPRVAENVPCADASDCSAFQYGYCGPGQLGRACNSGCRTDD